MSDNSHNRAQPGPANFNWKGGRTVDPRGYVLIKMPEHPAADVRGYVYEHRLVMERALGRFLRPGERVRHDDNEPGNNDPANLKLISPLDYRAMTTCACGCGTAMTALDNTGRKRRFVTGHNSVARGLRAGARPRCETGAGIPIEWREARLEDFGGRCAYGCGRRASHWDHLIAWSRGGSFSMLGNAVPSCGPCNQAKSDAEDPWPWIDRALASDQAEPMFQIVDLALSWGMLDLPDPDFAAEVATA